MSDIMHPISIDDLFNWITKEYEYEGTIFGIRKFYKADPNKKMNLFGENMEVPVGPAAGPHTQLTQNLVASYLTGSRFFELKTCQTLDGEDLPVSKPCILAKDEGYNVEWSTELRVPKAYEEYVKGWFLLKILSKELDLGCPDGFIFNMSVGYDLEGIKSDKIDNYITGMQDASIEPIWRECKDAAIKYVDRFCNIDKDYIESISGKVSQSITLSTLHGCPPAEIERIATYLLEEKGLNTFIKCNPTLLGYEYARETMDRLGFGYLVFDDYHFNNDLQFEDAVPMLKRLGEKANQKNLDFGVKITNTFPVKIKEEELPGEEMYMSGRALFPLSISVAKKLSDAFDGKLQVSYSGGADAHNIKEIFEAGIWPITVATTLLKSGGYQRNIQLSEILASLEYPTKVQIHLDKLNTLIENIDKEDLYKKFIKPDKNKKIGDKSPLIDCFVAPCKEEGGCPINQDIPAYLRYVGEEKYLDALKVIINKNPLPFITGTLCAHPCKTKCSRRFYESSVDIRNAKLEAANFAFKDYLALEKESVKWFEYKKDAPKTAIIGGGPAGIAAAFLLAREGALVTVFEKETTLGGVVKNIIPSFRIPSDYINNDIELAKSVGVQFKTGAVAPGIQKLREQGFKHIIYAIGAWKPGVLKLESGSSINALEFLKAYNENPQDNPYGESIVVVGGGNTAMDCARAATRLHEVKNVSVVYRRDKGNMPADEHELYEALEDGVHFLELLAPIKLEDGVLTCEKMVLGDRDESGRRSPVATGEFVEVKADTVVAAVGEKVDTKFYEEVGIKTNQWGYVESNPETLETNLENVYVIGDANLGPATIVEAIADATKAAGHICKLQGLDLKIHQYEDLNCANKAEGVLAKRGIIATKDYNECDTTRCLECATICETCVEVCPNRANVTVLVNGRRQVIHIDGMCNECGNCEVFCPYSGGPYKDKFTVFSCESDFYDSTNSGFYVIDAKNKEILLRLDTEEYKGMLMEAEADGEVIEIINTIIDRYNYLNTIALA